MGLTASSSGSGSLKEIFCDNNGRRILLAGNPNVGKSTLFNSLTGLHQHTGNWTGKTVGRAYGKCKGCVGTTLIDLPGCFSLYSRSEEERVARDCLYFEKYDKAVIVCDASCLERHLYLAYQILEIFPNSIICVNLADEAKKKGITVDISALSDFTGVPCVLTSAKKKGDEQKLISSFDKIGSYRPITYSEEIEKYINDINSLLIGEGVTRTQARVIALRLLDSDGDFCRRLASELGITDGQYAEIKALSDNLIKSAYGGSSDDVSDNISSSVMSRAKSAALCCTKTEKSSAKGGMPIADKLLIGKLTAFPIMLVLLFFILWITIKGANYPSALLKDLFVKIEGFAASGLKYIGVPNIISAPICEGIIRVTGWVISVMLPPMAIFFPLFTLLEDIGYLPRIAFNLDRCFKGCNACGKQALTMCMGLGCNAAGVVGCRIIDSPRERAIAVLTNSFMPCNGRFPMLIAVIGIFFATSGISSAIALAAVIVLAVAITLLVSKLLSLTVLKGVSSSFTLELPSYRMPNITQVLVRSVLDRTLFVLGRAVSVAAPTGLVIWILSNTDIGNASILSSLTAFFDPLGRFIGLDGAILLGFVLGLPANEIVIPIILMCYTSGGALTDHSSLSELSSILVYNGWSLLTAVNFIIFTVFHWPCSTSILTIKKETGSIKKAACSVIIPTAVGVALCLICRAAFSLFS